MATVQRTLNPSEAAIFSRLWDGKTTLTIPLARHILKLAFGPEDVARMRELAQRNSKGQITPAELDELDGYVKVGDFLAILQSKARRVLRQATARRNGH